MIERFVYLKLREEWANDEGRALVIAESARVLPGIPGVKSCRSGVPADTHAGKGRDLCLVLSFDTLAEVESYRVHVDHVEFLEKFLGPKVEAKRAWNFEMQSLTSPA